MFVPKERVERKCYVCYNETEPKEVGRMDQHIQTYGVFEDFWHMLHTWFG